jgi:hypothetical protein
MMLRYEIILYWSEEDQGFIAEAKYQSYLVVLLMAKLIKKHCKI